MLPLENYELLVDLGDDAGTDGTATLTDSETQALLDSDGGDQLNVHDDVIAGHAHVSALGQGDDAGDVSGTEVELRTVVVEEGSVTAAFLLGQDVDLASELGQGLDGAGLAQNLAALDVLLVDTTQQSADVVASLSEVHQLVEHLDVGDGGVQLVLAQTNDLDLVVLVDDTTLDTTGSNGATAGDGEDVLNGHQEGHVSLTVGSGDVLVDSVHQLLDAGVLGSVLVVGLGDQSVQSGTLDDSF